MSRVLLARSLFHGECADERAPRTANRYSTLMTHTIRTSLLALIQLNMLLS